MSLCYYIIYIYNKLYFSMTFYNLPLIYLNDDIS